MNEYLLDSELDLIYTEIMAATRPEDVFGQPATNLPLREQQQALQQRFEHLLTNLDPDSYTRVVDANAASDAKDKLLAWYEKAEANLVTGPSLMEFTVRDRTYHVGELIARGDHSVIHRAIATMNDVADEMAIKIALTPEESRVLGLEAEYIRSFHHAHQRDPVGRIARTLPQLIDTFSVEGRQVTVLPYYHGYRSVREILNHFNHDIPVGQAAWIGRRMLAFPLTADIANLEHTAMNFDHLLVHPITHEPIYIGWAEAKPRVSKTAAVLGMRETLALVAELFKTEHSKPVANTPEEITQFLEQKCSETGEIDGVAAFTEFTELIYKTLGKKYRPLKLT